MSAKRRYEEFNSGVLDMWEIKEHKIIADVASGIRFQDKTVGVVRFFQAQVASSKVDRLVSIPYDMRVERRHIVMIGKDQYKITLIQTKPDTLPVTMLLTLEKAIVLCKDVR